MAATETASLYDRRFMDRMTGGAMASARATWPAILPLLGNPRSIIDIGCGLGAWLAAIKELRPETSILGVDHGGVESDSLLIEPSNFLRADLSRPFDAGRRFDLCVCLEVAEHLPESSASVLVDSLVRHSNTILFSAAIPGQGGTGHINEQWPLYWIPLFEKKGFHCRDVIRPLIWNRDEITAHFRQNMLLFVKDGTEIHATRQDWGGASLVHPRIFFNAFSPPRNLKSILQFILRKNKHKFVESIEK